MATERQSPTRPVALLGRREWLRGPGQLSLVAVAWPAAAGRSGAQPASGTRLAAAWEVGQTHQVGWLTLSGDGSALNIEAAMDVPTRAHGLTLDAQGSLIAVARRPGDWLLRWSPGQRPQWHWMAPGRSLNGHAIVSPDGRWLLTTETDLDGGTGLLGVREARSLALANEWPTEGRDPHQLVWDRHSPGRVMVANGGITTLPETGRMKRDLASMDSSLVRIDAVSGRVEGQWRLSDSRLSLRHMAWSGTRLGIALQAEHDDAAQRNAAPVLAVFDGAALRTQQPSRPLAGYGGDVAALDKGFAVGCPRAGGLAQFDIDGAMVTFAPMTEACAVASDGTGGAWAAGNPAAARHTHELQVTPVHLPQGLRMDNHWLLAGANHQPVNGKESVHER